jgi:hypothetical protein
VNDSVALAPPSAEVRAQLDAATDVASVQPVVAADPLCLDGWAKLGSLSYEAGDDVASYAYSRVGYHRGLDLLRSAGWRPDREVLWVHEGNRGFLRSLYGLMRAAAAIGEGVEARRCREFLIQLDPSDPLEVGPIQPKDLSRRLPG